MFLEAQYANVAVEAKVVGERIDIGLLCLAGCGIAAIAVATARSAIITVDFLQCRLQPCDVPADNQHDK